MTKRKNPGWRNEPGRYALSAKGIETTAEGIESTSLQKWERADNYAKNK